MPVAVYLSDVLEPIMADEEFTSALNTLNMAAAKGMQFMVMDDMEGGHVAFNIPNINMFAEVDD